MHRFQPDTVPDTTPLRQPAETLWDIKQAAVFLAVSEKTVRRLIRAGELPHTRVGGQIRLVPDVIRQWVARAA